MSRVLVAGGLAATALLTAACGGSGGQTTTTTTTASQAQGSPSGGPGTSDPTGSAGAATTASPSLDTAEGTKVDAAEVVARILDQAEQADTVQVALTIRPGGAEVVARGPQQLSSGDIDMTLERGGDGLAYRSVDGRYYISRGGAWSAVDTGSSEGKAVLQQINLLTVGRQLRAMKTSVEQVREIGPDRVDGTAVTHYRIICDKKELYSQIGLVPSAGTIVYDLWADEDGAVRRVDAPLVGTEMTLELDAWGEPVQIVAPKTT